MAKITFITQAEEHFPLTADSGTAMELAVNHNVPGIDGDCGGVCSCATCHVHVAPQDWARTGAPGELERDMLEFDDKVSQYSRLSCQIPVTEAIDGITLRVAH